MFTRQTCILVLLALVISAGVGHLCVDSRQAQAQQPKDSKLREMLKERHAALKEIAQHLAKGFLNGVVSVESLHEAEHAVLHAELDLCDTVKERTAVSEKIVVLCKKQEESAAEAVKSGAAPVNVFLRAKVNRLEAEIALERLKSN